MGAKSAVKLRNRGIAFKCNLCGRKLMSPEALVGHKRTAHNIITQRREKPKPATKPIKSPKPQIKENSKETNSPTKSECTKAKDNIEMKKTVVEFECPKCFKRLQTYFSALKHIQKYHGVNKHNVNVEPNHPGLIQPVRVELCLKCDTKVKSVQSHVCDVQCVDGLDKKLFVCTACEECYPSLKTFHLHVIKLHGDNLESMFFPTSMEFTKWKTEMEQQTNASYVVLDDYESKRYYHCNYVMDNQDDHSTTYFCPSTIVIQEFSKCIQVHYYKQHYKHSCVEYKLSKKYKKYSITSFLKRTDDYNNLAHVKSDDNDLYMQFKTLMEGIVVDAAKINIATLKIILGKALEITSILTNYDEETDDSNGSELRVNENMTDSQIIEVLEEPLAKRKNNEKISPLDVKRVKLEKGEPENTGTSSPKILNSFSLAETESITKNNNEAKTEEVKKKSEEVKKKSEEVKKKSDEVKKKSEEVKKKSEEVKKKSEDAKKKSEEVNKKTEATKEEETKKAAKKVNGDDTPSSFNDSYKDFVVKNFPNTENISTRTRSKPIVKTRIGQFKPNVSPTDKKECTIQPLKTNPDTKADKKSKEAVVSKESKQEIIDTPISQNVAKRKISRISFDKPKVDYEYEVKEQEDDCNILILKL